MVFLYCVFGYKYVCISIGTSITMTVSMCEWFLLAFFVFLVCECEALRTVWWIYTPCKYWLWLWLWLSWTLGHYFLKLFGLRLCLFEKGADYGGLEIGWDWSTEQRCVNNVSDGMHWDEMEAGIGSSSQEMRDISFVLASSFSELGWEDKNGVPVKAGSEWHICQGVWSNSTRM